MTPDCFKRLAMLSRSKNAEMIRTYFIEIENLFIKFRGFTLEGMQNEIERLEHNQKPKTKDPKTGVIYILKVADGKTLYKIGRTKDLYQRLKTYQSGLADDIDVLYVYNTNDIVGTETCVKNWIKNYQYRKYKEVYEIDLSMLKEIISSCGSIGAKMHYKRQKPSKLTGGYFIAFDSS